MLKDSLVPGGKTVPNEWMGGRVSSNCKRRGTNENINTLLFGYPFYHLLLFGIRGDRTGNAFGLQADRKSKSPRR
jgi:hypothetical protein